MELVWIKIIPPPPHLEAAWHVETKDGKHSIAKIARFAQDEWEVYFDKYTFRYKNEKEVSILISGLAYAIVYMYDTYVVAGRTKDTVVH